MELWVRVIEHRLRHEMKLNVRELIGFYAREIYLGSYFLIIIIGKKTRKIFLR